MVVSTVIRGLPYFTTGAQGADAENWLDGQRPAVLLADCATRGHCTAEFIGSLGYANVISWS
jgi:hypothetical protein